MKNKLSRRGVLGGLGTGGALLGLSSLSQASTPPQYSDGFDRMEKTLGVFYSDPERQLMDGVLEDFIDRIKVRRNAFSPDNSQQAALTFNPLLKGVEYHKMKNRVALASPAVGPLPENDQDIALSPVWKQARWLRETPLTSLRLTKIYLKRIEQYAPQLECFATVTRTLALKQAARADTELASGYDRGPLHGIPYGLKDLVDTDGISTGWGAKPYQDRVPTKDATIVKRLREAGTVLLGKTTLGALAYGDRWYGGITRNPWALKEGSSGSSAGSSSATAAGLVSFAIGSETLGSIISPANRCGVVGLRPTFGRVARTGAMALCWSLDKIGPLCRYVEDSALILQVINGDDGIDSSAFDWGFDYDGAQMPRGLKVGYDPVWFEKADQVEKNTLSYLRDAGVIVKEISLPDLPYETLVSILEVESAAAFEELTLTDKDDLLRWQEEVAWPNTFRAARFHSGVEIMQLDRFRRHVMEKINDVFTQVDMLISPADALDLLYSTNYTGHPCLTLPVGMAQRKLVPHSGIADQDSKTHNLPRNIVLWGNMLREDQLITVGHMLEKRVKFHKNRPSVLY